MCQETGGKLTCPALNPNIAYINVGYNVISANIEKLKGSSHVFISGRRAEHFDEGCGVKETMIKQKAKWHKKCILDYTTRFPEEPATLTSKNTVQEQKTTDIRTRSSSVAINPKEEVCFLCKKTENKNQPLHQCMTFEIYNSIKEYASKAQDSETLAFLAEGDLVAQEAKYHSICVLNLHSKGKGFCNQENNDSDVCDSLAFADLLLYMHGQLEESGTKCAFKTSDLVKLYNDRYSQLLGKKRPLTDVHKTRFRERILLHIPDLQAIKSGREYILTTTNLNILGNFEVSNDDFDALAVNRFIRNIRKTVFSSDIKFTGSFEENCEEACIPPTLLALVSMLLYGSVISSEVRGTKPAISISQFFLANMLKSRPTGNIVRFNKKREPPLPLYIGLSVFGSSRDKTLIDNLHQRGISVSSNRIYELTADLARFVTKRAEEEGVVCPSGLQKGIFTVGAFDNIDVKPSSTTSVGEFHGSGISIFQLPLNGEVPLPRTWTTTFEETAPSPPTYSSDVRETIIRVAGTEEPWHGELDWLDHVHVQLTEKDSAFATNISWSAFRAEKQGSCPLDISNNCLLPLFEEKSATPGMVKHAMDLTKATTDFLNPGQIPALCLDQPLFTLARLLQWNYPETYGENKFVLLFGPLHIEQNFLRVIGDVLEGSGWSEIVANSGILPSGSAEGLRKVSSITKSRLFHQYTAAVLYSLLQDAFLHDHPDSDVAMETWIEENATRSPTFKFWLLVLKLELLLLKFVRSVREAQFDAFKESIIAMLPWFFSTGHHLYARSFVVRKTQNSFSALGIDHAHEQNNASIKSAGGALGLTQDSAALRRWTVAGPEVMRLLTEFEGKQDQQKDNKHHEQYPKFQLQFFENCAALKEGFLQSENPFSMKNPELMALDTRIEIAFHDACDGIVLDGAAIVRIVKPREGTASFQEFGNQVTNYCTNMASKMGCNRIDIVWDQYNENSLKATAPGTFPKRHKQWEEYLKNDGNKAELFVFLAEIALTTNTMQVVTNVKDIIRSNLSQNSALNGISCAGMEEADGRLFLHVQDMVQHGAKCVLIRCSDTDIVVIAISYYHHLHKLGLKELWVQYSVGTSKRFISAHSIAQKLGDDRACALRGFHAFTGCDSVSFFNGKGKASAWTAWDPTDEQMTRAFKILGMPSKDPPDHILPVLERFVVALKESERNAPEPDEDVDGDLLSS
ncbi:hypothetical protein FOCC_FOCC012440 [Frankliniella occidentalis]|nr:hypothetical protein FOCC_FOCC012440 [Frankliniella occidentalis]